MTLLEMAWLAWWAGFAGGVPLGILLCLGVIKLRDRAETRAIAAHLRAVEQGRCVP